MQREFWTAEYWRLALVLFGGIVGGSITGLWLVSFVIVLLVYIGWLLFKLRELHHWLEKGSKSSLVPDSSGIWEQINYHIQKTQKLSVHRKRKTGKVLKRFQGIITSLPYATVVLTGNNEIDWANKNSAKLLKLDLKKDRGQRIENLIRRPDVHKLLDKNKEKEIEISSPYDEQKKLALQLIPIQGDLKLLIARDISERVHLQQMRKNFIANASHELRTPLTVIAGYLEIMRNEEQLPEHLQTAVKAASEQSARMQNIIEDLLTLSRLENSELNAKQTQPLDITRIVINLCHDEKTITDNSHPINLDQLDASIQLNGEEAEIISLCQNLIHNAVRYTPDGTEINVIWEKLHNGSARFSVIDRGEGIPLEHLSHLTERFYRVDKGRSQDSGGTGLGLAIVQHIAQRHNASLSIDSEVGKGSKFEVIFPADRIINTSR